MKKRFFFFLLALITCPMTSLTAQNDYKKFLYLSYPELDSLMMMEYYNGAYDKAIPYTQAGQEKAKEEFGEQDSVFAEYTFYLGFFYERIGKYHQAEFFDLQAIAIDKKNLGVQHPNYAVSLNNLAVLYDKMGNYNKAEPLFFQAMTIRKKAFGEQHPEYAQSINNLAFLYENIGNYTKAESFYLEALAILSKTLGEQHTEYAISLINLAALYERVKNYTKSESLFLQAVSIFKKTLGEQHPDYATSLSNLALLYQNRGDYTKAETLFLQTLKIRKKVFGEQHLEFSFILNNLAGLYALMGNFTKAELFYLQGMSIQKKTLGEHHPNYTNCLNNLAILYERLGKLDTAFSYCQLGFIANAPTMDSNFTDWANLDTFSYISNNKINSSIPTLLSILQKQYDKTKDKSKLETHYAVSQAAIRLNQRFRKEFTAEGDKLRILSESNGFVLSAIKSGLELRQTDYESMTFSFAEMNKGILLLEAAKTANAQEFGELPDSLAEQEKNLQKNQSSLVAKLLKKRPEFEKDSLRNLLNNINLEIDDFTKILKSKFPKYAALKYNNKTVTAKEIQALLDDQTALLEYMIGDSVIYIFYIDKKQIKLTPVYLPNNLLNEKINTLHHTLSDYQLAIKNGALSYQKYTKNAFWFYENLVAPAMSNAKEINKLIIVSDGELGHLPFEAFLTKAAPQQETDYRELNYLNNDYKISYNYSATIWKASKEAPKNTNNGQLLAMASNYNIKMDSSKKDWRLPYEQRLRELLNPLPAARKEVEILSKNFNGFFAFDKDASEKNFKAQAQDYAIIHLAMHGLLDNKNPILSSLAFTENGDSLENNFLQAYEISKIQLNANLVVLSACETGYGRFDKGNGIASLAQAFAYAGAPAMIVSLWQVNDHATSEIMKNLYQNLADGMDKDEALQQAKLQYIKTAKGVLAHPAFWSPFIQMGNTDAVYLEQKGSGYWVWGIGIGVALLFFAVFKWSQRKNIHV